MADTAFSRAERGLGSTNLNVADIVAKTRGNPQEIMKLVMGGEINLTQGLLAKRLADSIVQEQQKAAAPTTTVLQDSFPGLAPPPPPPAPPMPPMGAEGMMPPEMQGAPGMPPMGGEGMMPPEMQGAPGMPPQMPPQMQGVPGMAEGGLAQLDFAAPDYAGGGLVAFAEGGVPSDGEEERDPRLATFTAPDLRALTQTALSDVQSLAPRQTQAGQAYMERLQSAINPEQERKRAEMGAMFQAIGAVRPGMNPLEALAQGFATTGASLQESQERLREREMEQLRAAAELERLENQMTQEELSIAQRLAQAEAGLLSEAEERRVRVDVADRDRESQEKIAQWRIAADEKLAHIQGGYSLRTASMRAASSGSEARPTPTGIQTAVMSNSRKDMDNAQARYRAAINAGNADLAIEARREYNQALRQYNNIGGQYGYDSIRAPSVEAMAGITGDPTSRQQAALSAVRDRIQRERTAARSNTTSTNIDALLEMYGRQ
jgi:hypothetical protein